MAVKDNASQAETLIGVAALAEKLNVHQMTIRKWQSSGKIPAPVRIGRAVKWRLMEIEAWIAAGCPARVKWEAMCAGPGKKMKRWA